MNLLDVVTSPWAIVPEKLLEIRDIYFTHLRGEKIDIAALEAKLGKPLANEPKGYEVIDGVALLPLTGVIAQRANMFMRISGATSSQMFARDLKAAGADPTVKAIVLDIDSPGGTVAGTDGAATLVRDVAQQKPVVAWTDATMASAAYWIGAAADQVLISGNTTTLGSIGVVAAHVDISRAQEMLGVKTTEITAGKYKRIASQYAPLSEEGRQSIQGQVDYLYAAFVDAVAHYRSVSTDQALAAMADGRVFIGTQAVSAGLADGVSSLDALIADLAAGRIAPRRVLTSGAGATLKSATSTIKDDTMDPKDNKPTLTLALVSAEHPQIAEALRIEGFAAGAAAERARIQAVEAQTLRGHEALIATLKFDGKTSGPEAAAAVLAAERQAQATQSADLASDAPKPLPAAPSATGAIPSVDVIDATLPVAERCKAQWDKEPAVRAEFTSVEAFTAFVRADEAGRVRVIGKK